MATGRIPINGTAAIQSTIVDAKGDLIVGTAADTVSRLAVGATNGDVLTVDSAEATGLKYATPAAGGKVLQVVNSLTTTEVSGTTSYVDSGMTATITPTSASSKILVFASICVQCSRASSTNVSINLQLRRGTTTIANYDTRNWIYIEFSSSYTPLIAEAKTLTFMDSPSTTSATTYTIRGQGPESTSSFTFQRNNGPSSLVLMEIGV